MKYLFFALRPKHWIKNLFVFMPLIFGQKLFSFPENAQVSAIFLAFCLMASSVYILNDLLNLEEDKNHRVKRLRPIASGKIAHSSAAAAAALLFCVSLAGGFAVNPAAGWVLVLYFVFNLAYSLFLRSVVIVDVFCIGLFFFLRIVAGTATAQVDFSHWMIFMVALLALFLGFSKRRKEIQTQGVSGSGSRSVLAKYNVYFLDQMISILTSSIVVVYMLYTVDERTTGQFGTNHLIYTIPFVYFGIFRYLYLVHNSKRAEDPTFVLFSDRMIQLCVFLWGMTAIAVIYFKL